MLSNSVTKKQILEELGVSESSTKSYNQSEQNPRAMWRQLTLSVYHSPNNLKLHTQRILFSLDSNLTEYVSGALHDLFIALNDKGKDLRLRMFNLASPMMSLNDRAYFQQWLSDNTDKDLDCYQFSGSVLVSKTCIEQKEIQNSFNNKSLASFNNPLDEIEYNIESGQLNNAQTLLEQLSLKNTKDLNIQKELQRFYFYTKNKKSIDEFMVTLKDSGAKIAKTWIDLQEISKTW